MSLTSSCSTTIRPSFYYILPPLDNLLPILPTYFTNLFYQVVKVVLLEHIWIGVTICHMPLANSICLWLNYLAAQWPLWLKINPAWLAITAQLPLPPTMEE